MTNKDFAERLEKAVYNTVEKEKILIKQLILDLIGDYEDENRKDPFELNRQVYRNELRSELRAIVEGK